MWRMGGGGLQPRGTDHFLARPTAERSHIRIKFHAEAYLIGSDIAWPSEEPSVVYCDMRTS